MQHDILTMRSRIKAVYPGRIWSRRVDGMPDKQVMAIYFNFLNKGLLVENKPKKDEYHQMTIDEFYGKENYIHV